jgi:hypothetical protein
MSKLSTLDELEAVVICEDCGSNTEWLDCDKHTDPDALCYRVLCDDCGWTDRDCDTTEHGEIIK